MKTSKRLRKEQRELFEAEKKRKKAEKHKLLVLANEEKRKREISSTPSSSAYTAANASATAHGVGICRFGNRRGRSDGRRKH